MGVNMGYRRLLNFLFSRRQRHCGLWGECFGQRGLRAGKIEYGVPRMSNNAISTDSSNTNLKIDPLGVVNSTVGMVGIPSSIGEYWTKPFEWTPKEGQRADFNAMLAAKDPRIPKEVQDTMRAIEELPSTGIFSADLKKMLQDAVVSGSSVQGWYPQPIGGEKDKGVFAKFNYDWEKITINYSTVETRK